MEGRDWEILTCLHILPLQQYTQPKPLEMQYSEKFSWV